MSDKKGWRPFVARALFALQKEFAAELNEFKQGLDGTPLRVCRRCFKEGEDVVTYCAFEKYGPCDRCGHELEPHASIAVAAL